MRVRVDISVASVNVDSERIANQVMSNAAFWTFAATQWHRLYMDYVPMDTGMLRNTVRITPGVIEHIVPYAHYQYMGEVYGPNRPIYEGERVVGWYSPTIKKHPTGRALKYSHKYAPKATKEWDKAAERTQYDKLIDTLQRYVDSGRLRLHD